MSGKDEFEKVEGIVRADPELDLPQFAQDLLESRNSLIEATRAAEEWAAAQNADDDLVAAIVSSGELDDDSKIMMLEGLPAEDVPSEVGALLDASRKFAEAQKASQTALDAEHEGPDRSAGESASRRDVDEGLRSAYLRLLRSYAKWGGYRYYGWTSQKDPRNYYGPVVWSEHDCVLRFAIELEKEFPGSIHTEFKINKAMRADYDPETDSRQAIDLVVSDLSGLREGENTQDKFRNWQHDVFIEAKWLKRGCWTKAGELVKRATDPEGGIVKDLTNLSRAVELGRCRKAGVLVFDDECFLDFHGNLIDWPENVERFVVSPSALRHNGLGSPAVEAAVAEITRLHRENCACQKGKLKTVAG